MLQQLIPNDLFSLMLVFARIGGAVMLLPGFGENYVSPRIRLFFALAITVVLTPVVIESLPGQPDSLLDVFFLVGGEVLIGVFFGGLARLAAVPDANVVITNPTHYSVALKYEMNDMGAPVVVAKGVDHIAMKIREVAKEHNVPIVENRAVAQALYAGVEIDQEVATEHFKAVAEVISYVMRLKGKL